MAADSSAPQDLITPLAVRLAENPALSDQTLRMATGAEGASGAGDLLTLVLG